MRPKQQQDQFTWKGFEALIKIGLIILGLIFILDRHGCENGPVREKLGKHVMYHKDSAYVVTISLDSVYYEEEEVGDKPGP